MTVTPLERIDRLRREFADRYGEVADVVDERFVRPDWAERNAELEADLLPVAPHDFLRHPCIRYQMFVDEHFVDHELPTVREHLGGLALAAEDRVGHPPLMRLDEDHVVTSSNTVHHLYHLARYEQATGRRIGDTGTVVEWGGGYGNLAKLLWRWHGERPTYVVIDTPIFSALQHLYLSSVLGEEQVALVTEDRHLVPGAVNVVPVGAVPELELSADLFVSTWAINESTRDAQRHVMARDWFGAEAMLVAMHRGDPLEPDVLAAGTTAVPIGDFMPAQHYFVR